MVAIEKDLTLEEIIAKLQDPFPAKKVQWVPSSLSKDKTSALASAYIDARDMMWRLDKLVGPFNWQTGIRVESGITIKGIGIRNPDRPDEFIWRWDLGITGKSGSSGNEKMIVLGSATVGFRRACAEWGIGRYLYHLPKTWVKYDEAKRSMTETPALPAWALPESKVTEPEEPAGDNDETGTADQSGASQKGTAEELGGEVTEITEEEVMLGDVLTYAVDTVEMKPKEAREWASDQAQKGNTPKQMLAILKTSNEPPV